MIINKKNRLEKSLTDNITNKIKNSKEELKEIPESFKLKNNARFKMPDRRRVIFKKLKLEIIKFIFIQVNTMMEKW